MWILVREYHEKTCNQIRKCPYKRLVVLHMHITCFISVLLYSFLTTSCMYRIRHHSVVHLLFALRQTMDKQQRKSRSNHITKTQVREKKAFINSNNNHKQSRYQFYSSSVMRKKDHHVPIQLHMRKDHFHHIIFHSDYFMPIWRE